MGSCLRSTLNQDLAGQISRQGLGQGQAVLVAAVFVHVDQCVVQALRRTAVGKVKVVPGAPDPVCRQGAQITGHGLVDIHMGLVAGKGERIAGLAGLPGNPVFYLAIVIQRFSGGVQQALGGLAVITITDPGEKPSTHVIQNVTIGTRAIAGFF